LDGRYFRRFLYGRGGLWGRGRFACFLNWGCCRWDGRCFHSFVYRGRGGWFISLERYFANRGGRDARLFGLILVQVDYFRAAARYWRAGRHARPHAAQPLQSALNRSPAAGGGRRFGRLFLDNAGRFFGGNPFLMLAEDCL